VQPTSTDASRADLATAAKAGTHDNTLAMASGRGLHLPNLCTVQAVFLLILAAELLVLVFELVQSSLPLFDWIEFANRSLLVLWQVLVSAALLCAMRRGIAQLPLWLGALCSLSLLMLVSALFGIATLSLLAGHLYINFWIIVRDLLVTAVIAGIALRYFYMQQQLRVREQAALQAQIDALQARIRPHFLFNSMNSIASLIATDPDKAEQAVVDLCDLFRVSLAPSAETVPLADELALCRKYIAIEQLRLGSRLQVQWYTDGLPATLTIPLLTLQPLLENAIYHGIQPHPQGGCVRIEAAITNGLCRISISNPLPVGIPARTEGNRMAINNIRARLHAIHGASANLTLSTSTSEFVATLSYPAQSRPVEA